jgi:hypothetical protein
MGRKLSRRDALTGGIVGAVALGAAAGPASAAETSIHGSWRITPKVPSGSPPFVALAAFAAGGVFITTGSDHPGTGIGSWRSRDRQSFEFAYTNFHFDSSGHLSSVVRVRARGTFGGSQLRGSARLTREDPAGNPIGSPLVTTFTGRRIFA